jgi:uncharacterized protein
MTGPRRLLASIHDVTPFHAQRLERLVPLLEAVVGKGHFALLVVPDFHRTGAIDADPAFARQLRGWADEGCEIFLHGFTHRDETLHGSHLAQIKAKRLTAGEGEFLGLGYQAASRKLADGRKMIEDVIGRPVRGFVAPAWLYSADSLQAIADQDFGIAEDHFSVWNPQNGTTLARGPVVTYASRTLLRLLGSLLWSRMATVALACATTVRFAVHPHDIDAPELVSEITRALAAFTRSHNPSRYSDLLTTARCGNEHVVPSLRQG